jgi:glutamyl-tRNA reductase
MQQVGLVGLSYRHAGSGHIAGFALSREELPERLPALRAALGVDELVYLSTCNRVELLFAVGEGLEAQDCRPQIFRSLTGREPGPGEARSVLRAWTGEAAIEHLFLVACGLDSAQAGEREIATQLRTAWQVARLAGTSAATLDHVIGEALSMSNRVEQLAAGARAPSLSDLAVDRARAHMSVHRSDGQRIALVGVSPMTRRAAERLQGAGVPVLIVNRTLEAARKFGAELAARTGSSARVEIQSLDGFKASPPPVAGVMTAAAASAAIVDGAALARIAAAAPHPPLLIDFGVPPNIEPEAARACGLERIGMDELIETAQEQRIAQLMRLAPVRAAIDERLARLRSQLAARGIGRQLAGLREEFERISRDEMTRVLESDLHHLSPQQKEQLLRFATTIARRLAHLPLAGMRAAAEHASAETVEAFFREARLQRGNVPRTPMEETHDHQTE